VHCYRCDILLLTISLGTLAVAWRPLPNSEIAPSFSFDREPLHTAHSAMFARPSQADAQGKAATYA
jgi:hypothetical protein